MKFACIFPGQGSQTINMLDKFIDEPIIKEVFANTKDILGIDYLAMLDPNNLNREQYLATVDQTIYTQPLVLSMNHALYLYWQQTQQFNKQQIYQPTMVAGHSLGEWNALIIAKVITFTDALVLVQMRAKLMQNALNDHDDTGAMAVILGLNDQIVIDTCNKVSKLHGGIVAAVNFNAPLQVVISGYTKLVLLAMEELKVQGAKKVQLLPISIPSHCMLMKLASEDLMYKIQEIEFKPPQIPIIHNINAMINNDHMAIKEAMIQQLYMPVLWQQIIHNMVNNDITNIVECGVSNILSNLNKRIDRRINNYTLATKNDINNCNHKLFNF